MRKISKQASRNKNLPPQKFEYILQLVNSLDSAWSPFELEKKAKKWAQEGIRLCDWGLETGLGALVIYGESNEQRPMHEQEIWINLFLAAHHGAPQIIKNFVGAIKPSAMTTMLYRKLYDSRGIPAQETPAAVYNRYEFLFSAKEILQKIAESSVANQLDVPVSAPRNKEASSLVSIRASETGKLEFSFSPLLQKLQEFLTGVDAHRIGQCPICKKIFWRGRTDQKACTPACSHALRNRNYRAQYPDGIKQRRIKRDDAKDASMRLATHKKPISK